MSQCSVKVVTFKRIFIRLVVHATVTCLHNTDEHSIFNDLGVHSRPQLTLSSASQKHKYWVFFKHGLSKILKLCMMISSAGCSYLFIYVCVTWPISDSRMRVGSDKNKAEFSTQNVSQLNVHICCLYHYLLLERGCWTLALLLAFVCRFDIWTRACDWMFCRCCYKH